MIGLALGINDVQSSTSIIVQFVYFCRESRYSLSDYLLITVYSAPYLRTILSTSLTPQFLKTTVTATGLTGNIDSVTARCGWKMLHGDKAYRLLCNLQVFKNFYINYWLLVSENNVYIGSQYAKIRSTSLITVRITI